MQKTNIEWTDYVFNPIKGLCPVDCKLPDGKSYCYARKIYKRFKLNPEISFVSPYSFPRMPSKIFVNSTIELFHPKIPKGWRDWIFDDIKDNPQHIFQILTKFPQNIDRDIPDNVWLGATITRGADLWRIKELMARKAIIRFVSYEPFLQDMPNHCLERMNEQIDWLIIGRITGHGRKHDPACDSLIELVGHTRRFGVPVFLKNNLKEIWGDNLIQEFPNKEGK